MTIRQWIAKWFLGIDVERTERRLSAVEDFILQMELE